MIDDVFNMDDGKIKRTLIDHVRGLEGSHRVSICKYRPRRSDRQNRYYWPCFVKPFSDWLTESQGEPVTPEQAHECLKRTFLNKLLIHPRTGEVIGETTRSTTELTTVEFNEYLDNVAKLLAELCDYPVAEPDVYHWRDEYGQRRMVNHG